MDKFNFMVLVREVDSKQSGVEFLQARGVLPRERFCKKGHNMTLSLSWKSDRWKCCRQKCRTQVGLRKGTWLESSKLPFDKLVWFVYCWAKEYTTTRFCSDELGLSLSSITDWKNYMREVCAETLIRSPACVGGEGETVEVDVWRLDKKKRQRDGDAVPSQWVVGGISRESRQCFLLALADCEPHTLQMVIRGFVRSGSTIVTDSKHCGLDTLSGMNYTHHTVNQAENFVDPGTGFHIQTVKSLMAHAKWKDERMCGRKSTLTDSYLSEFMWRQRHRGKDLFQQILCDIAACWPPEVRLA